MANTEFVTENNVKMSLGSFGIVFLDFRIFLGLIQILLEIFLLIVQ